LQILEQLSRVQTRQVRLVNVRRAGHPSPPELAQKEYIQTNTHAISVFFIFFRDVVLESLMDGLAEADMLDLDLDQVLQAKEFLELHSVLGTECHATETEDLFPHAFRPKQQPS